MKEIDRAATGTASEKEGACVRSARFGVALTAPVIDGGAGVRRCGATFARSRLLIGALLLPGMWGWTGAPRPLSRVGYQVLDLQCEVGAGKRVVTVAAWYPTVAATKPYTYAGDARGRVALNAAPRADGGPYPLLVFSHGYGGGGIGAVFLTEALAARGWIVVAPDHHDRHNAVRIRTGKREFDRRSLLLHALQITNSQPEDRHEYLYRLDEMQAVLDGILESEPFRSVIDRTRIAVGGHSFGGYTALGLCGTIPARHDSRIKALLLFSTGAGGYLYTEQELARVKMPSMLLMGEREKDARRGRGTTMTELSEKIFNNVSPPKYFLEVRRANHLSFSNWFGSRRLPRLRRDEKRLQDVIRRCSMAFLEEHVAGRQGIDRVLEQMQRGLRRCETQLGAEAGGM